MQITRRIILALALIAGIAPAIAQVPPPVPALPDTERRTAYTIAASNCACSVGFALYGDSTDYANWLEVWLNGVLMPQSGNWTITSPTGSLASIPRPITDAVLTFTAAQTGTVQIVGARRPRRTSQFQENLGVPTRNFNVVLSDLTAQNRELWDKTNDMTGRGLFMQPGNTVGPMPLPAVCQNGFLGFDATGLNPVCRSTSGPGNVNLPVVSGNLACFSGTTGFLQDCGFSPNNFLNGTHSGNTTVFATVAGTLVPGDCVKVDANKNLVDTGAGCGANSNVPHTQDFLTGTNFTPGTTTTLTLSSAPASSDLLFIAFDGVWQNANTWSVSGAVVTFSAAIPTNTLVVEAKWSTSSTLAGVGSIGQSGQPISGNVTVSSPSGMVSQSGQNIAVGLGNYTASGGTAQTVNAKLAQFVNVSDYGAVCNGTTDDLTAVTNALAAVPSGGTLFIPNGLCAVSNTITRGTPINFVGSGMFTSGFTLLSGASSSADTISIGPASGTFTSGYSFSNMAVINGVGRAAVNLNTFGTPATNFSAVFFTQVFLQAASTNANNNAIYISNDPRNANGGVFNVTVDRSDLYGGIFLLNAGDSIRLLNSLSTGPNAAMAGNQVQGAGNIVIDGNNVTNAGGGVVMECTIGMRISHNEFEQTVAPTGIHGAMLDLDATTCTMDHTTITENQIQATTAVGVGSPLLVRIGSNNTNTKLDSNRLGTPTSYTGVSNASATLLCGNNEFATGTPHVSGTAASSTWGNGC